MEIEEAIAMTEQRINDALAELRKEIERLEIGNQAAKERLANLVENIEQRIESSGTSEEDHDLVEEMKDAITHFEVEHPRITGIINDIMMTLSNVGI
jgi:signal transduction histidine kinase